MTRNDRMRLLAGAVLIIMGLQQMMLRPDDRVRSYLALTIGAIIFLQFFWIRWKRNRG